MERTLQIEELLNEAGWLRHLAASLVGDRAQAEDLVQDTWVAALRRPPRAGEPRPWLGRVVRNLSRNAGRDRSRREAREDFVHEERVEAGPDALAQEAEAQRLLAEAVTRLDEPLRAVIVLRYFQGLDSSAAAARLAVPPSTVRTRLQRALEALRADLDRRHEGGRESWAALLAPLARGAAVGTGATAVGSTALLVASAGAACVLAAIGVARWSSASDGPERASPVFVAAIPEPTPLPAVAASAGVQQSSREPVTADGREPEGREASELPGASRAASASAAGDVGELSGTILVDGQPPQWTIELFPELRIPRTNGDVPQQRWKLPEPISVLPEQRGAFTFSGVPLDGHLSLRCPHFDFEDGAKSLELDGPTTGLVLRLKSEPEVVGRIVGPDGQPIAPFTGQCELRVGRTGQPASEAWNQHFETRPDGRFRVVGNPAGEWTALTLLVKEEENGYLLHETPVYANTPHVDLGELRLERVRQVKFALRDPDGKSIPSGFAYVDGPGWDELEQVTHSEGGSILTAVPARPVDVRFGARGYADKVVRVGMEESVEVVLERVAMLEVRLLDRREYNTLVLTAERSAFYWDQAAWNEPSERDEPGEFGCRLRRRPSTEDQRFVYEITPDDNPFPLVGLTPDLPMTIETRDGDGPLASATFSMRPAEHAVLELGVADPSGAAADVRTRQREKRRSE